MALIKHGPGDVEEVSRSCGLRLGGVFHVSSSVRNANLTGCELDGLPLKMGIASVRRCGFVCKTDFRASSSVSTVGVRFHAG